MLTGEGPDPALWQSLLILAEHPSLPYFIAKEPISKLKAITFPLFFPRANFFIFTGVSVWTGCMIWCMHQYVWVLYWERSRGIERIE